MSQLSRESKKKILAAARILQELTIHEHESPPEVENFKTPLSTQILKIPLKQEGLSPYWPEPTGKLE